MPQQINMTTNANDYKHVYTKSDKLVVCCAFESVYVNRAHQARQNQIVEVARNAGMFY